MLDVVMMRLRTSDGLSMAEFGERFGSNAVRAVDKVLAPHEQTGLVERRSKEAAMSTGSEEFVALTDPDGFLVSNDIISDIFAALMPDDVKGSHSVR